MSELWTSSVLKGCMSGVSGTASTISDLVIEDPTNSGSSLKKGNKPEQTWKSLVLGESLHDGPESSGVHKPELNTK